MGCSGMVLKVLGCMSVKFSTCKVLGHTVLEVHELGVFRLKVLRHSIVKHSIFDWS